MGVALIGIGAALGFPNYMTAGAIVSGAYFGDKMSPLSDTTNLAPAVAGATLFDHIKHMVYTVGPSLIIAFIVYLILGFTHKGGSADESTIQLYLEFITMNYKVSLLYLIPPVFVIVAVIVKMPALPALIAGVFLGVPFAAMQGVKIFPGGGPSQIGYILNNGWDSENLQIPDGIDEGVAEELLSLLSGGGLQSMMWTISLIMLAMCFGYRRLHRHHGQPGELNSEAGKRHKRRPGHRNRAHMRICKRDLLRPVPVHHPAGQNVQGSIRRQKTCSEEPVQMSGRLRNDHFQLLPMEYLRRYHEIIPGRQQCLHSIRSTQLCEPARIHVLWSNRHHNGRDDRGRISAEESRTEDQAC